MPFSTLIHIFLIGVVYIFLPAAAVTFLVRWIGKKFDKEITFVHVFMFLVVTLLGAYYAIGQHQYPPHPR